MAQSDGDLKGNVPDVASLAPSVQACIALRKCLKMNTLVSRLDKYHTRLNWMPSEKNIKPTSPF